MWTHFDAQLVNKICLQVTPAIEFVIIVLACSCRYPSTMAFSITDVRMKLQKFWMCYDFTHLRLLDLIYHIERVNFIRLVQTLSTR